MTITRRTFLTSVAGGALSAATLAVPAFACPEPTLTFANTLRGKDLIAEGFAWCKVYNGFEGDGGLDVTEVGARSVTQYRGYRELVARLYTGRSTTAVEEAVLFDSAKHAHAFVTSRSAAIEHGADNTGGAWRVRRTHTPRIQGADEARWWHVRNSLPQPRANVVLAVVRVGDRIAFLRMDATASDPGTTMDTKGLLTRMAARLH